jgi:hypothetical protein
MATTIQPANLTVTVSTLISLNGQQRTTENQLVIPSITQYDDRIMTIPINQEVTVIATSSQVAAGTFIKGNLKYFQATNLDAVNYARIRVTKDGANTFDVKLDAGKTIMIGNTKESVSETDASFVTFVDWDSINAQADTAPVDIEYVVASI